MTDSSDMKEVPSVTPESKQGRWDWLMRRFRKESQPNVSSQTPEVPTKVEDKDLKEREDRVKTVLDELMLNPAVGAEFYDELYSYDKLKKYGGDLPLEKWTDKEKMEWKRRQWENRHFQNTPQTIRNIPVTIAEVKGNLKVTVVPVDLERGIGNPKDKEWSYGNVRLDLPDHPNGLHSLRYGRIHVWPKGMSKEGKIEKVIDGLRDTTPEEEAARNTKQTIFRSGEAVEAWEEWLPVIQELIDKAKVKSAA